MVQVFISSDLNPRNACAFFYTALLNPAHNGHGTPQRESLSGWPLRQHLFRIIPSEYFLLFKAHMT